MRDTPAPTEASTPEAVKAIVESREGSALTFPGENVRYGVAPGVLRTLDFTPYSHQRGEPLYRPLRIYALDPAVPLRSGRVVLVNIPYEPLGPGPVGKLFEVVDYDDTRQTTYKPVDLDHPFLLMQNGRTPSPSDPMFQQQMVYAVCSLVYVAFKTALGRPIAWGFESGMPRLRLRPHAKCGEPNAFYDKERGELCFGYYRASPATSDGLNLPHGWVFTCLSHDVIAHEVTHALLDGLRAQFMIPTGPDVLAFHEAFADLVALFQHFTYKEVLEAALQAAQGRLEDATLLTDIALQFGQTTGGGANALRSALDDTKGDPENQPKRVYDARLECHELGSVLVAAVFEAFLTVYRRKTARFLRLATGGSGVLPPGDLPSDLLAALAMEANKLASQFLSICIRAIDYCPPVQLTFGEYLRAVITADYDLVPDDPWGYREAWIDAFRRRRIFPEHVASLSEDALLWHAPERDLPAEPGLSFARLRFRGDPGCPSSTEELRRQACVLGEYLTRPEYSAEFGVVVPGDPEWDDSFEMPVVESVRTSRRAGPDKQIVFDLVAEVTQRRTASLPDGRTFPFWGGATVILGPDGSIRYVIRKSIVHPGRLAEQREFVQGVGRSLWETAEGDTSALQPVRNPFRLIHSPLFTVPSPAAE